MSDNTERVYALVNDDGATTEGVSNKLFMAWRTVKKEMAALVAAGRIVKVNLGKNGVLWYFRTQEAADAFKAKKAKRADLPPAVAVVKTKTSFEKGAQIIVPPHVQKQECPPFRGLGFREPEAVSGEFASMGIGRYMPDDDAMLRRVARKGAA